MGQIAYGKVVEPVSLHFRDLRYVVIAESACGREVVSIMLNSSSSEMLGKHQKVFEFGKHVANGVIGIMRQAHPDHRDFLDCNVCQNEYHWPIA